jgi:hypothetical protein
MPIPLTTNHVLLEANEQKPKKNKYTQRSNSADRANEVAEKNPQLHAVGCSAWFGDFCRLISLSSAHYTAIVVVLD